MVQAGLRLKREVVRPQPVAPSGTFTLAQVWVDSGVYHLDSTFSYLIPGNLADSVKVGSLVVVPFHGRELEGVVRSIEEPTQITGIKYISKVVGPFPILTPEILDLIERASAHYAAHPFDLIRSAIPDRVVSVEKGFNPGQGQIEITPRKIVQEFLQLPPYQSRSALMAAKISELATQGSVLVILPDVREVEQLHRDLTNRGLAHSVLASSLSRAENYENYLRVHSGLTRILIGTRSAIFAPIHGLRSIIIYNDGSEHLYEKRTPGWNARDIALMRSSQSYADLYFVGYSPSGDVAEMIESGDLRFRRVRAKVRARAISPTHGELIPSRALAPIKAALSVAPVLMIVPTKGFAQAIRCSQCRTISRCLCGGAFEKRSASAAISCNHCLSQFEQWRCAWCNGEKPALASRGIERHQQEIGLLFPGIPLHLATADHLLADTVQSGIVIATAGMAPEVEGGYSCLVIVEGDRFLNQPDIRASERVREMFFAHSALIRNSGEVLLIQSEGHSIVTALTAWNPMPIIERELSERAELSLPPYVRSASMTMASADITRLKSALESARDESRLPDSVKILGPITTGDRSSLILSAARQDGDVLIATLHEFMRRRSAGKKELPTLRVDPYSLSH